MIFDVHFYASEYEENHLAPDTFRLTADTAAEINREALDKIAERVGVARGLIKFESNTADDTDVLIQGAIGAPWTRRGYVIFVELSD